ncbi:MAG: excinuclease ABC subunit UvrA, partial [bacterium]
MNATNPVRMLRVVGASEHNLKNITVEIPRNTFTVITGLRGSGKSSLAFDTIYAEGQRRYVESLSAYARQFLDQLQKPNVDHIEGLSPAISIEQRTVSRNPRSTVGTVTEIYDYLRVVFANLGEPHCAECGRLLARQTVQQIVDAAMELPEGTKLLVLAPVVRGRKGEYAKVFDQARREGFVRAKVNGKIVELEEPPRLNKKLKHDISIVIDRAVVGPEAKARLTDSIETALKKAEGLVTLEVLAGGGVGKGRLGVGEHVFSEAMACPEHGPQIVELTPRMFSFNSPYGACPKCNGLGTLAEVDPEKVLPDASLSLREGAIVPWQGYFLDAKARPRGEESRAWGYQWIKTVCKRYNIGFDVPFKRLSAKQRSVLLYGGEGEKIDVTFESESGSRWESKYEWEGLIPRIQRRLRETSSDDAREHYLKYYSDRPCTDCEGARLKRESRAVTFHGKSLSEFTAMTVDEALDWIGGIKYSEKDMQIGEQALKEIRERLQFLKNVGLGYLTLNRASGTLAGGE